MCVCVRIGSLYLRCNCMYLVLSSLFLCYLQSRVGGAGLIEPMAVQFCARKVASVHGDVRKALDICRYAHTPHTLHTPSHLTLPHTSHSLTDVLLRRQNWTRRMKPHPFPYVSRYVMLLMSSLRSAKQSCYLIVHALYCTQEFSFLVQHC